MPQNIKSSDKFRAVFESAVVCQVLQPPYSFFCFTVIIDAIVLLTGKFDRNVAYRAALADTGDEDAESLNIMQAIILITVPTIGGM